MLSDTAQTWAKNPHGITMHGESGVPFSSFKKMQEAIIHATVPDLLQADAQDSTNLQFLTSPKNLSEIYNRPNLVDTTIGGNDAFNSFYQFGEDDDIVHPIDSSQPELAARGIATKGLGRVYREMYQNTQQILWLRFGVPKFNSLTDFYINATDTSLVSLMVKGEVPTLEQLGRLFGEGLAFAFKLPFLPIIGMKKILDLAIDEPINKYYAFSPKMPLYFRMVNVLMSHLASGMGLYRSQFSPGGGNGSVSGDLTAKEKENLPLVLRDGPDIFTIMNKRARILAGNKRIDNTDALLDASREISEAGKESYLRTLLSQAGDVIANHSMGGSDYIGFRIEKGTDATETVSNQTGPSSISQSLNAKTAEYADKRFSISAGNTGIAPIDATIATAKTIFSGIANGLGAGGAVEVVAGNGFFDIPEVWKTSSFQKSHSFTIQLRSRYGDPVSIYQSIYIPLCLLLAGALPRGIGKNTYTTPFILEAYAKGQFAIPLGMIESMTIKRGLSEFGWTYQQLPTAIDVTLNIKDLSPAMFLTLGDGSEGILDAFKSNTNMHEYLATLSGIGLVERKFLSRKLIRRLNAIALIQKNTTFSPIYWATAAGHSGLVRTLSNVFPNWRTPTN